MHGPRGEGASISSKSAKAPNTEVPYVGTEESDFD